MVENRFVGMKSRGVYETPGGTILHIVHRAVESLTMDREVMHLRDSLVPKFAELVYYGFWYSPEMDLLRQFMDEAQRHVTGTARLKLYKGNGWVVGRKSPTLTVSPTVCDLRGRRCLSSSRRRRIYQAQCPASTHPLPVARLTQAGSDEGGYARTRHHQLASGSGGHRPARVASAR